MGYASYLCSMTFGLFVCMIAGAVLLRKYARWKGIQPVNYEYADGHQPTRLEAIGSMIYSAIWDITTLDCSAEELRNTGMFWGGVVGLILGAFSAWMLPTAAGIATFCVAASCLILLGKAVCQDVLPRILPAIDYLDSLKISPARKYPYADGQKVEVLIQGESDCPDGWHPAAITSHQGELQASGHYELYLVTYKNPTTHSEATRYFSHEKIRIATETAPATAATT